MNKKLIFIFFTSIFITSVFAGVVQAQQEIWEMPIIGGILKWLQKPINWPPINAMPWSKTNLLPAEIPIYIILMLFLALYSVLFVLSTKLPFFKDTPHKGAVVIFALALSGIMVSSSPFANYFYMLLGSLLSFLVLFGLIAGIWLLYMFVLRGGLASANIYGKEIAKKASAAESELTKVRASEKREKGAAEEMGRDVEVQRKLLTDERKAVEELDKMTDAHDRLTGDEIERLQWVDSALERIARIRNTAQADRYKKMAEQQLAIIAKEVTNEYELERSMKKVQGRLDRIESEEFKVLKDEEHAKSGMRRLINREVKALKGGGLQEKDRGLIKTRLLESREYEELLNEVKNIVRQKEALINRIQEDLEKGVIGPNKQFSGLVEDAIEHIASDRLTDASKSIHGAIEIKKRQRTVDDAIKRYDREISRLAKMQRDTEEKVSEEVRNQLHGHKQSVVGERREYNKAKNE